MTDAKLLPGGKAGQVPKPSSETIPGFFARGVSYYKLFWVFFIASFLGAITETLFMLLTRGELQNRSGLIYGQFSLVWGLGAVLFTVCFHRLTGRRDLVIFLAGTVLGGAYEYLCSWVQEVLFGACFWDYSHIPLNINGRVSLLYSMFWGGGRRALGKGPLSPHVPLDRSHPRPDRQAPHLGAYGVHGGQHPALRRGAGPLGRPADGPPAPKPGGRLSGRPLSRPADVSKLLHAHLCRH